MYAPVASRGDNLFDSDAAMPPCSSTSPASRCERSSITGGRRSSGARAQRRRQSRSPRRTLPAARDGGAAIDELPAPTSSNSGIGTRRRTASRLSTQPTMRFHGSIPAVVEEVKKLTARESARDLRLRQYRRSRATGRNLHRVRRVVPPGQPHAAAGRNLYRRRRLPRRRRSQHHHREGVCARRRRCPDARLVIFGARDLFDESEIARRARPRRNPRPPPSSPTSAISPSATTSFTSNTASASTRD